MGVDVEVDKCLGGEVLRFSDCLEGENCCLLEGLTLSSLEGKAED